MASFQTRASRWQHRAKRQVRPVVASLGRTTPMPAIAAAIVAFQRAILNCLVVNSNPLAFHQHLDTAIHDTPGRWSAVVAAAATFAVRAYQLAVDVMGLNRPRSEC